MPAGGGSEPRYMCVTFARPRIVRVWHETTSRFEGWSGPVVLGFVVASKFRPDPLAEIVENQKQLRDSIQKSMDLAEKSQKLLDKHREDLKAKH